MKLLMYLSVPASLTTFVANQAFAANGSVNISGGTFGGNVEDGAGATYNIIKITGGTFSPSTQGNSGGDALGSASNAIYAGVSDASTLNKSTMVRLFCKI